MRRGYSFRPPLWALLLATAACAAFVALGQWQSGRALEKRAAGVSAEPVAVRGVFLAPYTVLLDNKLLRGRAGYHVVQPLRLAGEGPPRHVLVNRGWLAAGSSRAALPSVRTPAGEVLVEGLRRSRLPQAYGRDEPVASRAGGSPEVWQNATLERFAAWSGLVLEPLVIEQHSMLDDGLVRDWPPPGAGVDVHQSYALQWYTFAAASVALLAVLGWRRDGPAA